MHLTIAYFKIKKKKNLALINSGTHQRETLSDRPIQLPLINQNCYCAHSYNTKVSAHGKRRNPLNCQIEASS